VDGRASITRPEGRDPALFAQPKQGKAGATAVRLATPENIRTLQRTLYQKAKQEPGYRFYALYDKLYCADILAHAYRLVKANGGCPGPDGRSFEDIEGGEGVVEFLAELGAKVPTTAGWTAQAHAL
jgi:hypothetical protein